MRLSRTFYRLAKAVAERKYRTFILQGGTSSTKTYSILQFIYLKALRARKRQIFSIVSESVPHLRRGALRDWMEILGQDYDPEAHNKTDEVFKIGKCIVEFFAIDHPEKAKGGRRDHLYINEGNRISRKMRDQMRLRTRGLEWIDFNPDAEFWAHDLIKEDITKKAGKIWFDVSTYLDAIDLHGKPLLPKETVEDIEALKDTNPNWWLIYGLGQIGNPEGRIMPPFETCKKLPPGLDTTCGMDFGFTNDPSCLLESGEQGGVLYINQIFYGRGMTNQAIVKKMEEKKVPYDYLIFADNAEPKSIREIYDGGFKNVRGCSKEVKGEGKFNYAMNAIRQFKKICVTETSIEVIRDFRNAMFVEAITGEYTNKPVRTFLHSVHALIYSMSDRIIPRRGSSGGNMAY